MCRPNKVEGNLGCGIFVDFEMPIKNDDRCILLKKINRRGMRKSVNHIFTMETVCFN